MTGDLSEVKNTTAQAAAERNESYPAIRKAAQVIASTLAADSLYVGDAVKKSLTQAGGELSKLALEKPGLYLKSLSLIRALVENEVKPADQRKALQTIQASLWRALPTASSTPTASARTLHELDQAFIKNLRTHD